MSVKVSHLTKFLAPSPTDYIIVNCTIAMGYIARSEVGLRVRYSTITVLIVMM